MKFVALITIGLTLLLGACTGGVAYKQTVSNIAETSNKIAVNDHKLEELARPSPVVLVKNGWYVDTTPISLEEHPEWLERKVVIRGYNMPFVYYAGILSTAAGGNVVHKYQVASDAQIKIHLEYSGSIKGALDLLAAKAGYAYHIEQGKNVVWQSSITKTFSVAFVPGSSDYSVSDSGSASNSSSGGGASNSISFKGPSASVWQDIEDTIKQLISATGTVSVSQSSTSVTVHDKPANIAVVEQYIKNINNNLSKQVYVKIEVLDVALKNDYNLGVNWEVLQTGLAHSNFVFSGAYGSPLTITSLAGGGMPSIGLQPNIDQQAAFISGTGNLLSAVMQALSQQGRVALVAQPRIVCMNNQVSAIRIVNSEQYIQSIQNTSSASAAGSSSAAQVTSQITPATLVTGLVLYVLPKILDDKVYMQVNVSISQNTGTTQLCAQSGATANSCAQSSYVIQSPHVVEKVFNQRSILSSGQTLVLSGLKQITNNVGAMQLFNVQELGGKSAQQSSEETVILVTPYILGAPGGGN